MFLTRDTHGQPPSSPTAGKTPFYQASAGDFHRTLAASLIRRRNPVFFRPFGRVVAMRIDRLRSRIGENLSIVEDEKVERETSGPRPLGPDYS